MTDQHRELLFSVTIKDCDVQTFRAGGNGGQNQNKVESGVRIIHRASGARGECRETRDQLKNKRIAFRRMCESEAFKKWHKATTARLLGQETVEQRVDRLMMPHNLLVEERGEDGRWRKAGELGT